MRTALSIFRRDIRRIMRSPVAVIVTVGVCIIPSLYASLVLPDLNCSASSIGCISPSSTHTLFSR